MRRLRDLLAESWYGTGLHDMIWEVLVPVLAGIAIIEVAMGLFQWLTGPLNHWLGL